MTPVEIIALLLALLLFVKLFFVFVFPDARKNAVAKVYAYPAALAVVALLLGAVVLYYLLQELTIIQIFATCALFSLLFALSFAPFGKEMLQVVQKTQQWHILKKMWLAIAVWVILALWVLAELFW